MEFVEINPKEKLRVYTYDNGTEVVLNNVTHFGVMGDEHYLIVDNGSRRVAIAKGWKHIDMILDQKENTKGFNPSKVENWVSTEVKQPEATGLYVALYKDDTAAHGLVTALCTYNGKWKENRNCDTEGYRMFSRDVVAYLPHDLSLAVIEDVRCTFGNPDL